MTVMGDALMDGLSDAGSIPARSTKKENVQKHILFFLESLIVCYPKFLILKSRLASLC